LNQSIRATTKTIHIEKFKGNFSDIEGGCTVIHTHVLRSIRDPFLKGLYVHLLSLPDTWEIHPKQLAEELGVGIKKIYKGLQDLITMGLIMRTETREKGKYVDHSYFVFLSPNGQNGQMVSPNGQKPLSGEPNGHFGCTYKEEKLHYKKENKEKEVYTTSKTKTPSIHDGQQFDYYWRNPQFKMPDELKYVGEYLKEIGYLD